MPDLNEPIPGPITPASTPEQPVVVPTGSIMEPAVGLTPAPEPTPTVLPNTTSDALNPTFLPGNELKLNQLDDEKTEPYTIPANLTPEPVVAPTSAETTPDQVRQVFTDGFSTMGSDVMGGGLNVPPVILPQNPTPAVGQPTAATPVETQPIAPKKSFWQRLRGK